jgi:hypothetical protein
VASSCGTRQNEPPPARRDPFQLFSTRRSRRRRRRSASRARGTTPRRGPDGLPNARHGRLRRHGPATTPRARRQAYSCDRHDRRCHDRRPRTMPRRQHGRLHHPTRSPQLPREHPAAIKRGGRRPRDDRPGRMLAYNESDTRGARAPAEAAGQEQRRQPTVAISTASDSDTIGRYCRPFHGHGWFRTSDLSRVKRYVRSREIACSTCKLAKSSSGTQTAIFRSLRSFTGSSGSWDSRTARTTRLR